MKIRRIALISLIVCDVVLLILLAVGKQWFSFGMFVGITIIVGIAEIVAYATTKKTVSNHFTEWAEKHPLLGFLAVIAMIMALVSLGIHLLT